MDTKIEIWNKKGFEDGEVLEAIRRAKELTASKTGYRLGLMRDGYFSGQIERNLHLHIYVGHNIYTTSIYMEDEKGSAKAYYCNGAFWKNTSGSKVELI